MLKAFLDYLACRSGATALEYGLIAGAIALGIVGALLFFGDNLQLVFELLGNTALLGAE